MLYTPAPDKRKRKPAPRDEWQVEILSFILGIFIGAGLMLAILTIAP